MMEDENPLRRIKVTNGTSPWKVFNDIRFFLLFLLTFKKKNFNKIFNLLFFKKITHLKLSGRKFLHHKYTFNDAGFLFIFPEVC